MNLWYLHSHKWLILTQVCYLFRLVCPVGSVCINKDLLNYDKGFYRISKMGLKASKASIQQPLSFCLHVPTFSLHWPYYSKAFKKKLPNPSTTMDLIFELGSWNFVKFGVLCEHFSTSTRKLLSVRFCFLSNSFHKQEKIFKSWLGILRQIR